MSAVMGTSMRRVMRETAASISSLLIRSPSAYPRLKAIPALVVASALKPASMKIRALPASHALGSTSIGPSTWSRRKTSAFPRSSDVRESDMGGYLIRSSNGVKACCRSSLLCKQPVFPRRPSCPPSIHAGPRWLRERALSHARSSPPTFPDSLWRWRSTGRSCGRRPLDMRILEAKRPATPETQFRIGSVSKPLTADAVAQLYEAGKLDLDAPVQRYVPTFPQKGALITTRLLGGHLAGIRHYKGAEFTLNQHFASVTAGVAIFK